MKRLEKLLIMGGLVILYLSTQSCNTAPDFVKLEKYSCRQYWGSTICASKNNKHYGRPTRICLQGGYVDSEAKIENGGLGANGFENLNEGLSAILECKKIFEKKRNN